MRVTRAQAEENRRTVIETAARLFRERGFDGIGLADLMGAAGLTHGGFYKQFRSKDDLAAQACAHALAASTERWTRTVEDAKTAGGDPFAQLVGRYLSRAHRDRVGEGCALAALGPDAARHSQAVGRAFAASIESHLGILEQAMRASPSGVAQDAPVVVLSTLIGALVLSRLAQDETLGRRILDEAARSLLGGKESSGKNSPTRKSVDPPATKSAPA